jgi:hypothetical protein
MRHISQLSEVQLCGRHFRPGFDVLSYPGSRKARVALDRAVGRMHLDDWKSIDVGDPVGYFRTTLAEISRNAINAPGQVVVEYVLIDVFGSQFSGTLDQFKLTQIHAKLSASLREALTLQGSPTAITPGFEDMLPQPHTAPSGAGLVAHVLTPGPDKGGQPERYALEEALGSAFIDYFNGYSVEDDLTQAFIGYGGTDPDILNALAETFGQQAPSPTFGPTFDATLRKQSLAGGVASEVMNRLAHQFGASLRKSTAGHPGTPIDPVFADLERDLPT